MFNNLLKLTALYLVAILFTILNLKQISPSISSNVSLPLFELMIIYYFTIYRQNIFGLWFIFLIGIWSDALTGLPLGITSLSYIVVTKIFIFIGQRRSAKEDFKAILQEFVIFVTIVLLFKWLLLSIYYKSFYNITPFVVQIIISSLTYILIHKFCDFLSEKLLLDD